MEAVPTRAKWAFAILIALWVALTVTALLWDGPEPSAELESPQTRSRS